MAHENMILKEIVISEEIKTNRIFRTIPDEMIINNTKILVDFAKTHDYKIISVGCGLGRYEKWIIDNYNNSDVNNSDVNNPDVNNPAVNNSNDFITLIDPDQMSFCQTKKCNIAIYAKYKTVKDFLSLNPDSVSNCVLLLNYASPSYSFYDYEAIRDVCPAAIFAVYDGAGCAGSFVFHNFLSGMNIPAPNSADDETIDYGFARINKNSGYMYKDKNELLSEITELSKNYSCIHYTNTKTKTLDAIMALIVNSEVLELINAVKIIKSAGLINNECVSINLYSRLKYTPFDQDIQHKEYSDIITADIYAMRRLNNAIKTCCINY